MPIVSHLKFMSKTLPVINFIYESLNSKDNIFIKKMQGGSVYFGFHIGFPTKVLNLRIVYKCF